MSGIGPVEPVNTAETDASHDVIGTDAPRLADRATDRWRALSPRTRRTALGMTTTAAAVALRTTASPTAIQSGRRGTGDGAGIRGHRRRGTRRPTPRETTPASFGPNRSVGVEGAFVVSVTSESIRLIDIGQGR